MMESVVESLGILAAAVLFFVLLFNKFLTITSKDQLSTNVNKSYSGLIDELRAEMNRLKVEISDLKENYEKDINDLEQAHSKLELEVSILRNKNDSMRNEAISAYSYISNTSDLKEEICQELKDRLLKIIVDKVDKDE